MECVYNNYKTYEKYDDLEATDELWPETAKQWGLEDYILGIRAAYAGEHDDDKQLKIAKACIYDQGNIEKIKQFHEKNKLSYDGPYHVSVFGQGYDPVMDGGFPINWALSRGENDFALWLIQTKGVNLLHPQKCGYCCFHSLVVGIAKCGLKSEHKVLIKLLIDAGLSPNTIRHERTPLAFYMNMAKNVDEHVFQLFFEYGAKILNIGSSYCEREWFNLIFEAIETNQPALTLVKLYKARLDAQSSCGIEYFQKLVHMKTSYMNYFWYYGSGIKDINALKYQNQLCISYRS